MTAALPEGLAAAGVRSLEVRWIFPGHLEAGVARWFGRFPGETESRQDTYLLNPPLRGLSVKLRAGAALEVKVYRGSPGILTVTGHAHGRLQYWQKWSFPLSPPGQDSGQLAGWRPVGKRRRVSRFWLSGGRITTGPHGLATEPGCAVELTEIRMCGQAWWSLGFEAAGPAGLLHSTLEATATQVFAQALPGGRKLDMDESRSYAEWLHLGRDPSPRTRGDGPIP